MQSTLKWFSATILFLAVIGCSKGPKIVPVSGQVRIDGQPLKLGGISVFVNGSRPAVSSIDKDGRFSLTTREPNDGCAVGEHIVTIDSEQAVNETFTRHFIPKKYSSKLTSDVKIKVEKPTNDMIIDLTWKDDPYGKVYDTRD